MSLAKASDSGLDLGLVTFKVGGDLGSPRSGMTLAGGGKVLTSDDSDIRISQQLLFHEIKLREEAVKPR